LWRSPRKTRKNRRSGDFLLRRQASRIAPGLFLGLFLGAALPVPGETDWYISNSAGMALEAAPARLALRQEYALSVEPLPAEELPPPLREYREPLDGIELRCLYEEGRLSRRQWLFRDQAGRTRLVAAGGLGFARERSPEEAEEEPDYSGLIERYDGEGLIIEDRRIDSRGDEEIASYTYRDGVLLRVETRRKSLQGESTALYTDRYRYSRSHSLRGVERTFHEAPPEGEARRELRFPGVRPGMAGDKDFVNPGSAFGSDFLQDVLLDSGFQVHYTTDERGRILSETRHDEEGNVLGEILNHWSGDRLVSVTWKSGDDERVTEYEYDDQGDRVRERNYHGGELEREVRREGDREIEELYKSGRVVLRSLWEGGRKIREDRVRGNGDE
jgi:YD repeat-containing protein